MVKHRLSEEERTCDACDTVMEEIGKEVRRSLKMEPARFWIRDDVYYTYACKQCKTETGESNLWKTPRQLTLNCTPFVRQYGILNNKRGALLWQKENQTNDIHQNSKRS